MANSQIRVKIRGDQENIGGILKYPSSSSKYGGPATKFPWPPKDKGYEKVCSSYLRAPFKANLKAPPPPPPQQRTFEDDGEPLDNWALWTVWNEEFGADTDFGSEEAFLEIFEERVQVEPIFERNEWAELSAGGFVSVRMTRDGGDGGYFCNGELILKGNFLEETEVTDEDGEEDGEEEKMERPKVWKGIAKAIKLVAEGGLADILATVVKRNDLLVICGREPVKVGNEKVPKIKLNDRMGVEFTQILRLPGYQFGSINMIELIEPRGEEHWFSLNYAARWGKSRRDVEQKRRYFSFEKFGTDVRRSLAYRGNRWDFPVPVVEDTCLSIYNGFKSNTFTIFGERGMSGGRRGEGGPEVEGNTTNTVASGPSLRSRQGNNRERGFPWCEWLMVLIVALFMCVGIAFISCYFERMVLSSWSWIGGKK